MVFQSAVIDDSETYIYYMIFYNGTPLQISIINAATADLIVIKQISNNHRWNSVYWKILPFSSPLAGVYIFAEDTASNMSIIKHEISTNSISYIDFDNMYRPAFTANLFNANEIFVLGKHILASLMLRFSRINFNSNSYDFAKSILTTSNNNFDTARSVLSDDMTVVYTQSAFDGIILGLHINATDGSFVGSRYSYLASWTNIQDLHLKDNVLYSMVNCNNIFIWAYDLSNTGSSTHKGYVITGNHILSSLTFRSDIDWMYISGYKIMGPDQYLLIQSPFDILHLNSSIGNSTITVTNVTGWGSTDFSLTSAAGNNVGVTNTTVSSTSAISTNFSFYPIIKANFELSDLHLGSLLENTSQVYSVAFTCSTDTSNTTVTNSLVYENDTAAPSWLVLDTSNFTITVNAESVNSDTFYTFYI